MNKILLLILFLYSVGLAQYVTPGTGVNWGLNDLVINSGGVVTGSFPNYEITEKVTISQNDAVSILPGSIILFNGSNAGFDVNGIFKAEGTISDSIIFSSLIKDSTGAYNGLQFNDAAVDSECIISYAKIEYAYYGMRTIGASPTLQNSHLYKCRRPVQLSTSDAVIMNNKIELAYEYGILINLNSNPWIEGNEIDNNNTQAISSKNQISVGLQGNNSPVVKNNVIHGGSSIPTGGISLWVSGASNSSNMIIEGNVIYNNSFGITLLSSSDGVINALIKNNKIYNNNINPNMLVSGSGININGSPFNTPIVTGNEIFGNWWGVTIQNGTTVQAGPQPNFGNIENSDPDDDGMNIIHNNVQGSDVYDFYNNCTNDIWAQNNDWRVYDSISIEGHIFHQADDALHGKIIFTPFSNFIPVELISFSGSATGKTVTLKWETATENNNRGFEVEKSKVKNQNSKDEWEKIGFVDGYGTTTEKKSYTFFDKNVGAGKYNYRLKQIDYDGSINYSNIIEINIAAPQKFALSQNYPNPFNPTTNIEYHLPADAEVTLKLFNVLGEELKLLLSRRMPAGQHHYQLDASELRSGVYFYRIEAKSNDGKIFSETKKLVLVR